jgi:arylsulfatase A-like enzyme/predicted Zn-dependent protease
MNKTKKKLFILFSAFLILAAAVILLVLILKNAVSPVPSSKNLNFILISVDTLRADRLGCYGFSEIKTPMIDSFAKKGVKFDHCIAQTPLTLPSHTSLMTGTFPTFHGVRDNGGFLVPQDLITLAEIFKGDGYDTAAFVASYVLDSKWGLDQGFDHYFDNFDLSKYKTISLGNVQRRGDEVIEQVIPWLENHKKNKFFTWVHLYDPHTPYEPPSPYKEQYQGRPYLGEIAYTDSLLADLWQYLKKNSLTEKTILIFVADHGESLGEHKEMTHGFFVYQEGIHVPLIFVSPFEKLQGISRSSVVSLVDVMPTILEWTGMDMPPEVQGTSLLPLFRKNQKEFNSFSYSETFYPRFHYGWSELTTVQDSQYKLIVAPRLELYDIVNDPEELTNIIDLKPQEGQRLKSLIDDFIERTGQNSFNLDYTQMDEETRQKLSTLGYIGTFTEIDEKSVKLGDPKDKITIFNQLSKARELGMQEKYEEAITMLQKILKDDPEVIDAYFTLGNVYFKWEKFRLALESFKKAFEKRPNDPFTVINIANAHVKLGEINEAGDFIQSALPSLPPDSQVNLILGNIFKLKENYSEAEKYYRECLRLNPSSVSGNNALGKIFLIQSKLEKSEEYLNKANELNPKLPNLHFNLAQLAEARGNTDKALEEYLIELENSPHNFGASFNLSRLYRLKNETDKEQEYLEKTIESNPNFPMSYFYLARIYLKKGEKYKEGVELVKKGIDLNPKEENLPLGYFLLADLYSRLGKQSQARDYAQKAQALVQKNKNN